jgi:hypothetical protein
MRYVKARQTLFSKIQLKSTERKRYKPGAINEARSQKNTLARPEPLFDDLAYFIFI